MALSPSAILEVLSTVIDRESKRDIVRLDRIKNLSIERDTIAFTLIGKAPSVVESWKDAAEAALRQHFGADIPLRISTDVEMISLDVEDLSGKTKGLPAGVRNYIAVASGKGGVGKSTVAANLAVALAIRGYDVGLVDTDIYGPSVPTMFGLHRERPQVNEQRKIVPLEKYGVKLLSMGFLVDPTQATIWRGPMVSSAIRQFLGDTEWGELDYLVLDLPPGTGDIQLTIVQTVALTGAIIVSTPQDVALADARKGIAMFRNVHVPVIGIVENMAYFSPPDLPDRKYYLFGRGGARRLAGELAAPFLGEVPLEEIVREGGDDGRPVIVAAPRSASAVAFDEIAAETVRQVTLRNAQQPPTQPIEILHR